MEERYQGKARKLRGVLTELGLKLGPPPPASGGPFVPVKLTGLRNGTETSAWLS